MQNPTTLNCTEAKWRSNCLILLWDAVGCCCLSLVVLLEGFGGEMKIALTKEVIQSLMIV
jgi:hypothetical protein